MAPLRVKSTIPMGPQKIKNMVYKAKVELPWCQRHITSAWRLQSRLEGEVETLKRVNATLQATSEEALAAADQRNGVLQQQVAALQQQMQHAESNVQVVVAEYERQMSALTTAVQVTKQELRQRQVKEKDLTGVVAREQARANAAKAEAADAQSKLNASLLTTRQLEHKLQGAMTAASTATAKSARLKAELERAESRITEMRERNRHDWEIQRLANEAIDKSRTQDKELAEENMRFHQDYAARMNQKEDMRLAELSQKAEEITRLKETMAKLDKEMQGKALQIKAMEEDTSKMKGSLTHEIRRLEALLTITKEGAADAMAAAARVRHELEEERAEKAQVKAQLIDAKVDFVRERSKATADLREKIRCLELNLNHANNDVASLYEMNSHLQEANKSLQADRLRCLLWDLVRAEELEEMKARQSGQRQAVKAGTAASTAVLSV